MERDPSNNAIVTTDAEQALLREHAGSDVRRAEQHLAIARRALLEGRLAAGEHHLIKAAQACEEHRPAAAEALWWVVDEYDPTRAVFRLEQHVFADAEVGWVVDAIDTIGRDSALGVPVLGPADASQQLDEPRMDLVRARESFAHDEPAQAEQALDRAIGWLHMNGVRPELVGELEAFIDDFDPGRLLYELEGSALESFSVQCRPDILLADLDDIAARHGIDIATAHGTGFIRADDLGPEQLLERRMQRMQVGEHITLANGTTVAQHERGYVVDATLVGHDADVGAAIGVERDSARAHHPASAAGARPDGRRVSSQRSGAAIDGARDARDVAALCQARPARHAAITGGAPAVSLGGPRPGLQRPADRGAGR